MKPLVTALSDMGKGWKREVEGMIKPMHNLRLF
jgi:hypothetical protein